MGNFFEEKISGRSPWEIAGWVLLAIVGFSGLVIFFGFILMWLWNWLMPDLFGLPIITFWQGMGLCLLAKIFFGGFGGGGGSSHKKDSKKHKMHRGIAKSCKEEAKAEISKWKMYDQFWEDEGNKAFEEYVSRKRNEKTEEE